MNSIAMPARTFPNDAKDSKLRVLLVEDDPASLFAFCRLIEREGLHVDSCSCLQEAVRHIESNSYLAAITDLRLGGTQNVDGYDVIKTVRKLQPDAKIILTTGYGSNEVEQTARNLGASYFFRKPVIPASLLTALREMKQSN